MSDSDSDMARDGLIDTFTLHIDELRAENARLREENERLRLILRQDAIGVTISAVFDKAKSLWQDFGD